MLARLEGTEFGKGVTMELLGVERTSDTHATARFLLTVGEQDGRLEVCVPSDRSGVLCSLLLAAYDDYRGQGYWFLNIGLSLDDPLTAGVSGLMAQHTDVWGLVAGPAEGYAGRPLHHEIALV